ncbi:nucleotide exchange factor GrpE [Candidatus Woesearchaeota archaeon]|nr:nucleotide exchange factor GrpE [Candidatus Woesearchaeota archaeon]
MAEAKAYGGKKENEKKQIQELTETLQRLQADFENYKKHADKEKEQLKAVTTAKVIAHLLPVIDAFDLAIKNSDNQEQLKKGVEMLYAQFSAFLKNIGVKAIEAETKKLDPSRHEVLLQEEKAGVEDDTIIEELQKGYMLNDFIIRTSKVKIARKKEEKSVWEKKVEETIGKDKKEHTA